MAYSEESASRFAAPVFLGSLFGPTSSDDDDDDNDSDSNSGVQEKGGGRRRRRGRTSEATGQTNKDDAAVKGVDSSIIPANPVSSSSSSSSSSSLHYEYSPHFFPHLPPLSLRQFDDHIRNANICWPEANCLAEWIVGVQLWKKEQGKEVGLSKKQTKSKQVSNATSTADVVSSSSSSESPPAHVSSSPPSALNDITMLEWHRKKRFDSIFIGFDTGLPWPDCTLPVSVNTTAAATAAAPCSSSDKSSLSSLIPPICQSCHLPLRRKRVLELGAATGALSIFLAHLHVDIHTSDYDDASITENIACNFKLNGLEPPVHLQHTWGKSLDRVDAYIMQYGYPNVILGSDILAYEDELENLVQTIVRLMPEERRKTAGIKTCNTDILSTHHEPLSAFHASTAVPSSSAASSTSCPTVSATCSCPSSPSSSSSSSPVLILCWKRNHNPEKLEKDFWARLDELGFQCITTGQKVYQITRRKLVRTKRNEEKEEEEKQQQSATTTTEGEAPHNKDCNNKIPASDIGTAASSPSLPSHRPLGSSKYVQFHREREDGLLIIE